MYFSLLFAMRNLFVVLSSFLDKERDSYFKTSSVSYPFKQREKGYIFYVYIKRPEYYYSLTIL